MMNVMDTDNNNYNYYNHYSESHRSAVSTTWSSEDPPPPTYHDRNFHRHRRHQHPGGGADYSVPARKRPFSHGPTADCSNDGRGFMKLYVADIPRTVTEEEIRSLFEVHGSIVEIAIVKDPRTGQQKEYCFVKYTTMEEADRAIGALNYQYAFPGAAVPIKVRYADGERDRLVNIGDHVLKLYVNGLNKQASKWEIGEIFSAYGQVENIHIVRDEFKQSRGCGFIQFARRDMAIAAKNALDGKFIMMGCDQPLLIRFADPKKPRFGDIRNTSKFGDSVAGSHFQEPVVRPVPYFNDSMAGNVPSNVSRPFSPKTMASPSQSPRSGGKLDTVCSTPIASEPTDLVDCDWSEHTCPDGYKYYYNCVSCESRWEKPQEYSLFEHRLQKQQENQQQEQRSGSGKQSHCPSTPQVFSMEEIPQFQQTRIQSQLSHLELQQTPPSASELDHVQVSVMPSALIGPTCG